MDRALTLALSGLFFIGSAQAGLQLTPKVEEYDLDGAKLQQLVFFDGTQRIIYAPPHGWEYSGSSHRFILHPRSVSTAEATISVIQLSEPQVFDDATMKRLSDEVISSVPSSATHVTIVTRQKNPLLIERKETFLVVANYECYGNPYTRSVMFVNRKNEQLRFQLTCPPAAFPELQKAFQSSHYSWQNL